MKSASEPAPWMPPPDGKPDKALPDFLRRDAKEEIRPYMPASLQQGHPMQAAQSSKEYVQGDGGQSPSVVRTGGVSGVEAEPDDAASKDGAEVPAEGMAEEGEQQVPEGDVPVEKVEGGSEPDAEADAVRELTESLERSKQKLEQLQQRYGLAVSGLGELAERMRSELPAIVADCAVAVAERILGKEIEAHPAWILQNARECIERIGPNGPLRLRLHPEDRQLIAERQHSVDWLNQPGGLELVPDATLRRGDCILESSRARIDATVARQLESLRPFVEDAVARWLSNGLEEEKDTGQVER